MKVEYTVSKGCQISWLLVWLVAVGFSIYYKNVLIQNLSVLSGIIFVWLGTEGRDFQRFITNKRWNIYLTATFFIFCFHDPLLGMLKKGIAVVFSHEQWVSLAIFWLLPFLVIEISIGVFRIMKRFFPFLLKVLTGGRD